MSDLNMEKMRLRKPRVSKEAYLLRESRLGETRNPGHASILET